MKILEFARERGFELLPWQEDAARMVETGRPATLPLGRGNGVTFFIKLVEDWKRECK